MPTYSGLKNFTKLTAGTTTPKWVDYSGGYLWGYWLDGTYKLFRSADHGATWVEYCDLPTGAMVGIRHNNDGEVLYAASGGVYLSSDFASGSPTWDEKVNADNGTTAYMLPWGFDGYGDNFIATHYSSTRPDSRYVWITTDGGANWSVVWDSDAKWGTATADTTHLHGVCYDRWDDVFYVSEGHSAEAGIYKSTDDGSNWSLVDDDSRYGAAGPAPTVLVATPGGIVFGSDHPEDGIDLLPRGASTIVRELAWGFSDSTLEGFANDGALDESTGIAYIGFQSDVAAPATIFASDGSSASVVWRDSEPTDSIRAIAASQRHVAGYSDRSPEFVFAASATGVPLTILDSATLLLRASNYSGSGDWLDESGNGLDATINGPTFTTSAYDGKPVFSFTSDDYMTIADDPLLDFDATAAFTVLVLGRPTSSAPLAATQAIVNKGDLASPPYYLMRLVAPDSANQAIVHDGTTQTTQTPSDATTAGQLHAFAMTRNATGDLQTVLDATGYGTPDGPTTSLENARPLSIGARYNSGYEKFMEMELYGVAIWRTKLTFTELDEAATALTAGGKSRLLILGVP